MTTVRIPPTLRPETGGERQVEAAGGTVRELLDDLVERFPALRDRILEGDEPAEFVNVYVDGEDVRTLDGPDTPVREGATVILLPAMAGGATDSLAGDDSRRAEPGSAAASRRRPPSSRRAVLRALSLLPPRCPTTRQEAGGS